MTNAEQNFINAWFALIEESEGIQNSSHFTNILIGEPYNIPRQEAYYIAKAFDTLQASTKDLREEVKRKDKELDIAYERIVSLRTKLLGG